MPRPLPSSMKKPRAGSGRAATRSVRASPLMQHPARNAGSKSSAWSATLAARTSIRVPCHRSSSRRRFDRAARWRSSSSLSGPGALQFVPAIRTAGHTNRSRPTNPRRGVDDASAVRRPRRHVRSGCAAHRRRVHRALRVGGRCVWACVLFRRSAWPGDRRPHGTRRSSRLWSFGWCSLLAHAPSPPAVSSGLIAAIVLAVGIGLSVPGVDARDPSNYVSRGHHHRGSRILRQLSPCSARGAHRSVARTATAVRAMVIWDC